MPAGPKGPKGRPQGRARTGETYALAEFLNDNWDRLVGRTNDDVAGELGYKGGNMISMWRTGHSRVPLERLPDVARLMKVDLMVLLPMWLEQYVGDDGTAWKDIRQASKRFVTERQAAVIDVLKRVAKDAPVGTGSDPLYADDQLKAIEAVLRDEKLRKDVIAKAQKAGVLEAA